MIRRRTALAAVGLAALPDIREKLLSVARLAHHQPTAEFARQVDDDKLDIKLE
jgi:hypothetical protein